MQHTFPLEQLLIDLHQQPLVTVLQFLHGPHGHGTFRNLAENVFVGAKPLDFERSGRRLASSGKAAAKYVKCPMVGCASRFKSNAKLLGHMQVHPDLKRLTIEQWDDLMNKVHEPDVKPTEPGAATAAAATMALSHAGASADTSLKRVRDE